MSWCVSCSIIHFRVSKHPLPAEVVQEGAIVGDRTDADYPLQIRSLLKQIRQEILQKQMLSYYSSWLYPVIFLLLAAIVIFGKVMFSALHVSLSAARWFPAWPHMDLFKIVNLGIPDPTWAPLPYDLFKLVYLGSCSPSPPETFDWQAFWAVKICLN